MKKFLSVLSVLILLASAPVAFATIVGSDGHETIGPDQVVDDDLFMAADSIVISGTVNGDVYAAAEKDILVDGQINGDLYLVGREVRVTGIVEDDVMVASGKLILQGAQVGDSVTLVTGEAELDAESQIGGAVLYATGHLNMQSQVGRGLMGQAQRLDLSGSVGRSALVSGMVQNLAASAVVNGNFHYVSQEDLVMAEGATVAGEVRQLQQNMRGDEFSMSEVLRSIHSAVFWITFVGYLILGLLTIHFFPKHGKRVNDVLYEKPLQSLLLGFASLILIPLGLLFLFITVVGWPLAWVLGLVFVLWCALTRVFIGNFYGDSLARLFHWKKPNPYAQLVLGLLAYAAIKELGFAIHPTLGFFIGFLSFLFTFGAMGFVLSKSGKRSPK